MQSILKSAIVDAAANVGGIVKLSLILHLSRATVSAWKKVPDKYLLLVEEVTGVPREKLRPDLYRNPV